MSGPGAGAAGSSGSGAKAQPSAAQTSKPNYNLSFSSVIGGREERGVRGPSFGRTTDRDLESISRNAFRVTSLFAVSYKASVLRYEAMVHQRDHVL